MISFSKVHQALIPLMDEVDELLKEKSDFKTFVKAGLPSQSTLVTQADLTVDGLFRTRLSRLFPTFGFLTEEGADELKDYNWIIDPIDGTGNFSRKLPFFGVSVALWKEMEPVYGICSLPKLNQRMWAIKGEGCFMNGEKITRSSQKSVSPYVLLASVGTPQEVARVVEVIGETVGHPRDFGSCVYQIMQTILGKADLMVGYQLSIWDFAAGWLLAEEAGFTFSMISSLPQRLSQTMGYRHSFGVGQKELVLPVVLKLKKVIDLA